MKTILGLAVVGLVVVTILFNLKPLLGAILKFFYN
jgi:hypothetical protein